MKLFRILTPSFLLSVFFPPLLDHLFFSVLEEQSRKMKLTMRWYKEKWEERERGRGEEREKQPNFFAWRFFSTGSCLGPVLNASAFSTDWTVPGREPVLTGGSRPVLMPSFLVVFVRVYYFVTLLMYTWEYLIMLFFLAQRPYWFVSVLPRNPILFPYPYFPNLIPFPPKKYRNGSRNEVFRPFLSVFIPSPRWWYQKSD